MIVGRRSLVAALDRNDPVNVNEPEPEPGFASGAGAGSFTGSLQPSCAVNRRQVADVSPA
ncbi:MAG TPA: hypothetical protein VLC54_10635 [Anaeromyxobacter sp.]|nr:hypothetical protein [Anaeromyxobacter sp.]